MTARARKAAMFTSDDDGQICTNVIIIAEEEDDEIGPKRASKLRSQAGANETASLGSNREYCRVSDWIWKRGCGAAWQAFSGAERSPVPLESTPTDRVWEAARHGSGKIAVVPKPHHHYHTHDKHQAKRAALSLCRPK